MNSSKDSANEYIRTSPTKGEIALMQCGYFLSSDLIIKTSEGRKGHVYTYTKDPSYRSQYIHSRNGESYIRTERIKDGDGA